MAIHSTSTPGATSKGPPERAWATLGSWSKEPPVSGAGRSAVRSGGTRSACSTLTPSAKPSAASAALRSQTTAWYSRAFGTTRSECGASRPWGSQGRVPQPPTHTLLVYAQLVFRAGLFRNVAVGEQRRVAFLARGLVQRRKLVMQNEPRPGARLLVPAPGRDDGLVRRAGGRGIAISEDMIGRTRIGQLHFQ